MNTVCFHEPKTGINLLSFCVEQVVVRVEKDG